MTLSEKWKGTGGKKRRVESGSRDKRGTEEAGKDWSWGAKGRMPLG